MSERDELDAIADAVPAPAGLRRDHEIRRAIDAGLAAPAATPRRIWPWAVLGATVAAAAIMIFVTRPAPEPEPAVVVERGAISAPAIGQVVEVSPRDRVVLRTPDASTVEASELTRFVRANRAATRWQLERGQLRSHVTKRAPGQTFEVITPEATVAVVGTRFTVDRSVIDGVTTTSVHVDEGVVRVTPAHGATVTLHAGEQWPAPVHAETNPPHDEPSAPHDEVTHTDPPHDVKPPRPAHTVHPFDATAIRKTIRAGNLVDAHRLIADGRKAARATPDLAELGILAAEAELAGRATKHAIELYLAVVRDYPKTPQAEQALFAAAQLAFDRPDAGYRPEAILRDYLDSYPHGQFAGDARRLLNRSKN